MPKYLPESTSELLAKIERQKANRRRLFFLLIALFAIIALGIVLPKFIQERIKHSKTTIVKIELDIARKDLTQSEIKRLEKKIEIEEIGPELILEVGSEVQQDLENTSGNNIPKEDTDTALEVIFQPLDLPDDARASKALRAGETIAAFLAAQTPEQKAAYVINPGRVLPLMRQYYAQEDHPIKDSLGNIEARSFFLVDGQEYLIQKHQKDASSANSFYISLLNEGDDIYKIDWEAMVGHSEISWGQLLDQRPSQPTLFRCLATYSSFYNFNFGDPEEWASFELYRPHTLDSVYGYARRGSETEKKLQLALKLYPRTTVTLRLSIPENSQGRRLVHIDEFIQNTWFAID